MTRYHPIYYYLPNTQGERNPQAKLTAEQVREIRRRDASGEDRREMAKEFGINERYLYCIVTRRAWRHVREI